MSETIIDILENYAKFQGYYPLDYNFLNRDFTISVTITHVNTENSVNKDDVKKFNFGYIDFKFPFNNTEQQLKDVAIQKVTKIVKKDDSVFGILIDTSTIKMDFDIQEGIPIIWLNMNMKYVLKKDVDENEEWVKPYIESMNKINEEFKDEKVVKPKTFKVDEDEEKEREKNRTIYREIVSYNRSKQNIVHDILNLNDLVKKLRSKLQALPSEDLDKIKEIFLLRSKLGNSLNEEDYDKILSSIKEF